MPTRRTFNRAALAALAGCTLAGCALPPDRATGAAHTAPPEDPAPPAPREWRAAWVASVANIDWPRPSSTDGAALLAQADAILDRAAALRLNALILQVRPAADAVYPSRLEPWSEVLTGTAGRPPGGGVDPLAHWVEGAHRRGLALHAWFNPYRARHASMRSGPVATHLSRTRPDLVKTYGDQRWLDPGEPDAAAHSLAVIADVLRRYDIDGVHVDDYFYPYPVTDADGRDRPFPDEPAWRRYRREGGRLGREDWRRDNVDRFVEALYRQTRAAKPWVQVGISPFGIGQPARRPPGIEGFSQYDKLYADVERWLAEGWLDYLAPQLYWRIDRPAQAFEVLRDYWLAQNPRGRHVWPGLFTDRVRQARDPWPADEVLAQVTALRRRGVDGHAHFSMTVLMGEAAGLSPALRDGPYAEPALPPPTPWLGEAGPAKAPGATPLPGGWRLEWPPSPVAAGLPMPAASAPVPSAEDPAAELRQWAVWRRLDGRWRFSVQPAAERTLDAQGAERCVVSAVDRLGREGPRRMLGAPNGA